MQGLTQVVFAVAPTEYIIGIFEVKLLLIDTNSIPNNKPCTINHMLRIQKPQACIVISYYLVQLPRNTSEDNNKVFYWYNDSGTTCMQSSFLGLETAHVLSIGFREA